MSFDPAQFAVRLAEVGDAEALAQVFDYTWNAAYRSVLPEAAFQELPPECSEYHWRRVLLRVPESNLVLAAVDEDNDPVGVATAGPDRLSGRDWAEIYALYVMPGYQGLGLGRRLLSDAFRMMCEAGYTSGIVWTLSATESHGFYRRLGGDPKHQRETMEWGQLVAQTGYVWPDLGAQFGSAAPPGAPAAAERAP